MCPWPVCSEGLSRLSCVACAVPQWSHGPALRGDEGKTPSSGRCGGIASQHACHTALEVPPLSGWGLVTTKLARMRTVRAMMRPAQHGRM